MIKVSVLYPKTKGSRFDIDYYCNTHMPLCEEKLGRALKGYGVEHGVGAGEPPPYAAVGYLLFDSVESFQKAFGEVGAELRADIPNYTDVQPVVQVSEIRLTR